MRGRSFATEGDASAEKSQPGCAGGTSSDVMKGYNWAGPKNIFTNCGFRCKRFIFSSNCAKKVLKFNKSVHSNVKI